MKRLEAVGGFKPNRRHGPDLRRYHPGALIAELYGQTRILYQTGFYLSRGGVAGLVSGRETQSPPATPWNIGENGPLVNG